MQLTSVIHIRPGSWAWADSLLAVFATTGSLLLFCLLDGPESGLAALCGGFASLYGLGEPLLRRLSIVAGAGAGMTAVIVVCSLLEPSPLSAGLALAVTAAMATYVIDISAAGQPGMIMFLVTGSVTLGLPPASDGVVHRGLMTAGGATIAVVAALSLLALHPVSAKPAAKPGVDSARNHALWMGVATFTTATLVIASDVPHWQWAPISTAAVLQSTGTPAIFARAVQRSAGTVVGVMIAAGLLLAHPSFVGTVLVCSLCLGASQLLFPRNYALGIVSITPLAFLLPGLIHPASDMGSLLLRVWATVFGAMLGVLMWYFARRRLSWG